MKSFDALRGRWAAARHGGKIGPLRWAWAGCMSVDGLNVLIALIVLGAIGHGAFSNFDLNWDVMSYHLPFAARLTGLCGRDCFVLSPLFEARYASFPKAIHLLQGLAWWLTGNVNAANSVNFIAFLGFLVYLRRVFSVPWWIATIALSAIPLVQIHLSSGYVDLIVNLAVATAFLSLFDLSRAPDLFGTGKIILFFAALAVAANGKLQMLGVAGVLAIVAFCYTVYRGRSGIGGIRLDTPGRWIIAMLAFLILAIVISLMPIANAVAFHNPFYPIAIHIGRLFLPGPEPVTQPASIAEPLKDMIPAVRWLRSVLEVHAYDFRFTPWTVDQGNVAQSAKSFRIGGYFGFYVLLNVFFFLNKVRTCRGAGRIAAVGFCCLTVLTAVMPLAHELRYYMYWMICLVSFNLIMLYDAQFAGTPPNTAERSVFRGGALAALISVICVTGGASLKMTSTLRIDDYLRSSGISDYVRQNVRDGQTLCIRNAAPREFLYTRVFFPGRSYRVIAEGSGPECDVTLDGGVP